MEYLVKRKLLIKYLMSIQRFGKKMNRFVTRMHAMYQRERDKLQFAKSSKYTNQYNTIDFTPKRIRILTSSPSSFCDFLYPYYEILNSTKNPELHHDNEYQPETEASMLDDLRSDCCLKLPMYVNIITVKNYDIKSCRLWMACKLQYSDAWFKTLADTISAFDEHLVEHKMLFSSEQLIRSRATSFKDVQQSFIDNNPYKNFNWNDSRG
ncbi:hypothetical protein ASSaV_gp20 [Abalone shriveling syndrome-associated virus]|uniref:hypothetical protein n=1 Tax=Abalone shriveling syndrome-associated virus TaxID=491893 RepID=UPI0001881BAF|nr:hypothetical protein ASSaV_gp20 [Abalone shriveling syndrome-associated virus]ACJ71984.1 unknown [Abalone shriveling syndrome-associated virus]